MEEIRDGPPLAKGDEGLRMCQVLLRAHKPQHAAWRAYCQAPYNRTEVTNKAKDGAVTELVAKLQVVIALVALAVLVAIFGPGVFR